MYESLHLLVTYTLLSPTIHPSTFYSKRAVFINSFRLRTAPMQMYICLT